MLLWARAWLCSPGQRKYVSSQTRDIPACSSQLLGEETPQGAAIIYRNFPFHADGSLLAASFKAAMKREKKEEKEREKGFVEPMEKGLSRGAAPLQSSCDAGAVG